MNIPNQIFNLRGLGKLNTTTNELESKEHIAWVAANTMEVMLRVVDAAKYLVSTQRGSLNRAGAHNVLAKSLAALKEQT